MQLRAATRIFARELRGGMSGFKVFVACLSLGVASVAAIGSVRSSIVEGLRQEGAALLGGDAEIQFSYRRADEAELLWMNGNAEQLSEVIDFRSMATVDDGNEPVRSLTQIKAIDSNYPLYGEVQLDPPMQLHEALEGEQGLPGAVVAPSLAERLGIEVGDEFQLGTVRFRLSGPYRTGTGCSRFGPASGAEVHCSFRRPFGIRPSRDRLLVHLPIPPAIGGGHGH